MATSIYTSRGENVFTENKYQSRICQALAYMVAHIPTIKPKVKYEYMKKDKIFAQNDLPTTIVVSKLLKFEHINRIQVIYTLQSLTS